MQSVEEKIVRMLREFVGRKTQIIGSTRIYHDLGIAGDDMDDLFVEIQNEFGTSFNKFDFKNYCPNDLDAFIDHVTFKIGLGGKWDPFTVDHLVQVVKSGAWFDP